MVWQIAVFSVLGAAMGESLAWSQTLETPREVYFNEQHLVLVDEGNVTRFITPKSLSEFGRFQVTIKRPKAVEPEVDEVLAEPSLAERIEARRLMHDANQAFENGEVAKTWELVARAESLDPAYYRIKTMKGSLLFKIGSTDLALEVWQESLALNPDQPEILAVIKNLEASGVSRPTVARGEARADKKASLQ